MSSPLEQFQIKPIIPMHIGGVDISFTQSSLWMGIGVMAATLLLTFSIKPRQMVPGRFQNISEMFYELVSGMIKDNIGDEGKKYFPFVFSLFMIVLMGNLLGLIPYSFTYTSHIVVTGALALGVFILATAVGFIRHGLHFFSLFLPAGLPFYLAPLVVVIEVISYLSRPISLSVRLFMNMLAGHTLLKIIAGFSVSLGVIFGILPMALNIGLVALEFMIAFIQAYVFAILTCMYLKDAIKLH